MGVVVGEIWDFFKVKIICAFFQGAWHTVRARGNRLDSINIQHVLIKKDCKHFPRFFLSKKLIYIFVPNWK